MSSRDRGIEHQTLLEHQQDDAFVSLSATFDVVLQRAESGGLTPAVFQQELMKTHECCSRGERQLCSIQKNY